MHELDITQSVASFASARVPAWHRLGTVVDHTMRAEEVLRTAHLDNWNVRKLPLQIPAWADKATPQPDAIEIPDRFAIVRDNPIEKRIDYLGVAGSVFHPMQNEETTTFLDAIVEESGAHYETAGGLRGGREVFVSMKMPQTMDVTLSDGSTDSTELYVAALNAHDGSAALRLLVTPIRIVCANTAQYALQRAVSSWSVRHTTNMRAAVDEARRALALTFKYEHAFEDEMAALVAKHVDNDTARALLSTVFDVAGAGSERQENARIEHVDSVMTLRGSPTNRGTGRSAYNLLNATTEYIDYFWPSRAKDGTPGVGALASIKGDHARIKQQVFGALVTV
jgi:phage/plasmid-like protein (TIGR03299 family)